MPRPRKCCQIAAHPRADYYKPRGIPMRGLQQIALPLEGLEALRLADLEGCKQEEAATRMKVSRPTFQRILHRARHAVAEALTNGYALRIEGGHYRLEESESAAHPAASQDRSTRGGTVVEKIAISTCGPALDDPLDTRFGRAGGFLVVDPASMEFEYLENGASQTMAQGAGIQAAENVAGAGATVVLTGFVGPKAFRALTAAGIRIGQNLENLTVREALARYTSGQVEFAAQPNKESHWS